MEVDTRAAKLALARKKLKDHQDKKHQENFQKCDLDSYNVYVNDIIPEENASVVEMNEDLSNHYTKANATEFLVSSKRNLELQLMDLQTKNVELENNLVTTTNKYDFLYKKVNTLENELKNVNLNYNAAMQELQIKDVLIKELNDCKASVFEEKTNLQDQLEFTKSILTAKEAKNDSLQSELLNIKSQLDATQLQLQQVTSGGLDAGNQQATETTRQENEILLQKVNSLEQQLKSLLKDYQQVNSHYEQYVGELNVQLKTVSQKNEDLNRELQNLSNREIGLIEQISEMEIRIQNYNTAAVENTADKTGTCDLKDFKELQEKYENNLDTLQQISTKYEELQKLYNESNAKVNELSQPKEYESKQSNEVSLLKLNADITSDKVAAQRATEQNKKLKHDLQGLEEAVVKMTKDKLELTEKITAEKYLNRELTIKLAEIDEKANNLQTTLKAKDEEMIRLLATYRDLEEKMKLAINSKDSSEHSNNNDIDVDLDECKTEEKQDHKNHKIYENRPFIICHNDSNSMAEGDAMLKLQDRFLKIMEEVADLSDEKHRLEHIIMQLQNETDTICEYVALYQQQRSLLKKRDEERNAQIKMFQSECNSLQNQLDELTDILKRFSQDKELSSYFQIKTKHEDFQKVMTVLSNLKTSSLLDPHKSIEFNNFYPCSCCSGQLIDV